MMAGTGTAVPVPESELNKLRYSRAIHSIARRAATTTLTWLYQGGSIPFKEYLTTVLGFTNTQYKTMLDRHQRQKLEAGDPIDDFDITLCYVLLRKTCGLAVDDQVWIQHDPQNPKLEYKLYCLKQHRNRLAHENLILTKNELEQVLQEVEELTCAIYERAGALAGKDAPYLGRLTAGVKDDMLVLRQKIREQVDALDLPLLQQEIKKCSEQLKDEIEVRCKQELTNLYTNLCAVQLAPWLSLSGDSPKPTQIFTRITLKEETSLSKIQHQNKPDSERKKNKGESEVEVKNLLQVRTAGNKEPVVWVIMGDGGFGKSTLLKYILEQWTLEEDEIDGLAQFKVLLYTELRYSHIRCLEDLLEDLLRKTRQEAGVTLSHLKTLILDLPLLFVFDGYDEKTQESHSLISEVLNLRNSNTRLIISTRRSCIDDLNALIPSASQITKYLHLCGIKPLHHTEFIARHIECLVLEEAARKELKSSLGGRQMSLLRKELGDHLNSPLILSLLVMLWVERLHTFDSQLTITQLFNEFRRLITKKLIYRLQQKGVADAEYKCAKFLKFNDELCFRTLVKGELEYQRQTISDLEDKCWALDLPPKEVLSSYYNVSLVREGLAVVTKIKPHHQRFQEHYAAHHIAKVLATTDTSESTDLKQLLTNPQVSSSHCLETSKLNEILLHTTGLLATSHPNHLSQYITEILDIVSINHNNGSMEVGPLLRHITEAKNSHCVQKAVGNVLRKKAGEEWCEWKLEENCMQPLMKVIHYTLPTVINIYIQSDPNDVPFLKSALTFVSRKATQLEVYFMMHYWTRHYNYDASGELLRICVMQAVCKLTGWGGRLGVNSIAFLPDSLVYLTLRLDPDTLTRLSHHLPRLSCLHFLEVYMEAECGCEHVPQLGFTGQVLRVHLCAPFTDTLQHVTWAADAAAALWPGDLRGQPEDALGFHEHHLSSSGAALLLYTLAHRRLRGVTHLWVELEQGVSAHEEDQLRDIARDLLSTYLYV